MLSRRTLLSATALVSLALLSTAALADPPLPPAPANPGLTNVFNAAPANTFSGKNTSISIAVHGADSSPATWANGYITALTAQNPGWDGWAFDWNQDAKVPGFTGPDDMNIINAQIQGQYLAKMVLNGGYTQVHLYGHSLGGRVIQSASTILSQTTLHPTIQTTFLDPYTPYNFNLLYGTTATWSDEIVNTNDWLNTNTYLANAFDVDVTPARPATPTGFNAGHSWPYLWYKGTIDNYNANAPVNGGMGYPLSLEKGAANWPAANPAAGTVDVMNAANTAVAFALTTPASVTRNRQNFNPNDANEVLNKSSDAVDVEDNLIDMHTSNNGNEWVNLALNLTATTNFIDFKFNFATSEDGTLSVRVDGVLLWAGLDQYALTNQWEDSGILMGMGDVATMAPGMHVLSYRLDTGPSDGGSNVQIKDINTGFLASVPEPASLAILGLPALLLVRRRNRRLIVKL